MMDDINDFKLYFRKRFISYVPKATSIRNDLCEIMSFHYYGFRSVLFVLVTF